MAEDKDKETRRLHKEDLVNSGAPSALGLIVARQLIEYGESTLYLDEEGFVAVAAPGEIGLDAIPEQMAIVELMAQGWSDIELMSYLKGRDARLKRG